MEYDFIGHPILQCKKCGKRIHLEMCFTEATWSEEHSMGAEIGHDLTEEIECPRCGQDILYRFFFSEYPMDVIDSSFDECDGADIIESPELVSKAYDYFFYEEEERMISESVRDAYYNLKRILDDQNEIYNLTSREFEELVAEVFSRQGYNVKLTPQTRDGGYDIIATKNENGLPFMIIIECKHYRREHKISVDLVRKLYGVQTAIKANKSILVTTSLFTADARREAEKENQLISLIDINDLLRMIEECR